MLGKGYLVVQTYGSMQSFGVKNVKITIGGETTYYTDENGFTSVIEIEAPDASFSEKPGTDKPYTTIDVRVEKENYYTIILRNVQIFTGMTSKQNVGMLPLPESIESETIEYSITPQNL